MTSQFVAVTLVALSLAASASAFAAVNVSCDTCVKVMSVALTQNKTTLDEIAKLLNNECGVLFPTDNSSRVACDLIADGLTALLPEIDKGLTTLAWNIPFGFCSVFIPVCKQPCCSDAFAPEQVHLSFPSSDLSTMRAAWVTLNATATSTVQWGASPSLGKSAKGSNRTYTEGGWVGQIHEAVMTGLTPGTTYYYRVGDAQSGWSDAFSFTTLPLSVGSAERPLRLIQIADMGYGPASNATVAAITAEVDAGSVDVVVHPGDVSYADGYMNHWDDFFRKVQPFASRVPYMTGPGNHELWYLFKAYKTRWYNPGWNDPAVASMYWSLDIGTLHLTMTDTETFIDTADISPAQKKWIEADLAAANAPANRKLRPWVVAMGHRPLYCTDGNPTKDKNCVLFAKVLRDLVEDVYLNASVDLVVAGHMHGYERFWPTAHSNATQRDYNNPTAPAYVVNGAAGNREGNENPRGDLPFSVPGGHSGAIGYARIAIAGPQLSYTFVDSANGTVIDAFTITKAL